METEEYYGGTYPSPNEDKTKEVKITICVEYELKDEFPKTMGKEEIKEWVEEEFRYIQFNKEKIIDIEVECE